MHLVHSTLGHDLSHQHQLDSLRRAEHHRLVALAQQHQPRSSVVSRARSWIGTFLIVAGRRVEGTPVATAANDGSGNVAAFRLAR